MPLIAYNKTTTAQPVVATNVTITTIPAGGTSGVRNKGWDVTKALQPNLTVDPVNGATGGRSAAEFAAIQSGLIDTGNVELQWLGAPEYLTDGLDVGVGDQAGIPAIKTATFTAQIGMFHRMDPTGGAFAANLPIVSIYNKGRRIELKNSSASVTAITVTPNGVQTIDGAATLVMNVARQAITLISDGVSNWEVA